MEGIPIKYRIKDFQNTAFKKCSPLAFFLFIGHIIEFDERIPNYKDKLKAIRQQYGRYEFYVGLTDLEDENVWKWSSSGRILSPSSNNIPWDDGEPNNVKSEDCALVQAINLYLIDINCSIRSNIICEKNVQ